MPPDTTILINARPSVTRSHFRYHMTHSLIAYAEYNGWYPAEYVRCKLLTCIQNVEIDLALQALL